MPPKKATIQRSTTSAIRSEPDPPVLAPAPVLQPSPPSTAMIDPKQFNLLIQRVQGLIEMVQAMRQPSVAISSENPPSGCQDSILRKSTWVSIFVAPRKEKQKAEDSCSNHDSFSEETFSIYDRKPSKVCDRDDVIDQKLWGMDRRIEELGHVAPAHHDDVRTDLLFSL